MADTHDDSTGLTAFYTYLTRRADKIVPLTAREQEAERLIFKEIHNGDLELRWLDIDGRVHIGLPRGWSGWYGRYDQSADAIRELPLLPNARVLYQPQVRERQRNLDQPADSAVEPEHADLDTSAHEIFPPDSNPSAVAAASPPASASPLPPFEPAPSEPASSSYGELEANKAAEEGLTPDVLTADAPDQVSKEQERDDAVAQTKTARATKTARGVKKARIKSLLPDLDKKGRLKPLTSKGSQAPCTRKNGGRWMSRIGIHSRGLTRNTAKSISLAEGLSISACADLSKLSSANSVCADLSILRIC